jgi:hypothetical protein
MTFQLELHFAIQICALFYSYHVEQNCLSLLHMQKGGRR